MTDAEVMTKLQDVFNKIFLQEVTLTPQLSAKDVEEWDSLTHINLLVTVEKVFGIRFRVGEVEKAQNVGEFVRLIQSRLT